VKSNVVDRATVADRLRPVIETIFGAEPPVRIRAWDGSTIGPAEREGGPTIVVRNRRALRRLVWSPDEVGMARAFVSGDLAVEGDFIAALDSLLHLFDATQGLHLNNADRRTLLSSAIRLGAVGRNPAPPAEEMRPIRGRRHSARRDAAVISHHYDVGNEFYRHVLGESMTYSCAYWPNVDDSADNSTTLEEAQRNKVELISRKLGLKPGMRLLDVGCGWGTMAIHAASEYGVHVVGVTNSHEQAVGAAKRAAQAGVADLVEIREMDYRDIDDGPYDAISSIGMAEHVGRAEWHDYAKGLYDLLKPGGRLLNHQITEPPKAPSAEPVKSGNEERTFITAYVFPDGELQSVGQVSDRLEEVGFEVRDVESLREHYARTLRAWVSNLEQNWNHCVQLSSVGRARVWRLYMAGSALAFDRNRISIHQVLAVRPDRKGRSRMPATRASYATVD
jgi:cyclopropane-fatty-acyl-phospholipid synthase